MDFVYVITTQTQHMCDCVFFLHENKWEDKKRRAKNAWIKISSGNRLQIPFETDLKLMVRINFCDKNDSILLSKANYGIESNFCFCLYSIEPICYSYCHCVTLFYTCRHWHRTNGWYILYRVHTRFSSIMFIIIHNLISYVFNHRKNKLPQPTHDEYVMYPSILTRDKFAISVFISLFPSHLFGCSFRWVIWYLF